LSVCRYSTADRPFSCLKAGVPPASTSTEVDVEFGDAPVAVPSRPGPSPSRRHGHSSPVVHEVGVQPTTPDPAYAYPVERRPSAAGWAAYNISYGRTQAATSVPRGDCDIRVVSSSTASAGTVQEVASGSWRTRRATSCLGASASSTDASSPSLAHLCSRLVVRVPVDEGSASAASGRRCREWERRAATRHGRASIFSASKRAWPVRPYNRAGLRIVVRHSSTRHATSGWILLCYPSFTSAALRKSTYRL
jgi:hypothetical protein